MNNSLLESPSSSTELRPSPGRRPRACCGDIAIADIEGIVVYSSAAWEYISWRPCPRPPGAAQEARYPADTLGDIQAQCHESVTVSLVFADVSILRIS